MNVNELRPFQKKVNMHFKVLSKTDVRDVQSKLDNSQHKVCEAVVGDQTGKVLLTLWDETIDSLKLDKTYDLENGFTSLFKKSIRLNIGRYGKLSESVQEISEVKDENFSEKEFNTRDREFR